MSAALAAAILVNLPIRVPTDEINFRAEAARCVGDAYVGKGKLDEAERHFRRALKTAPRDAAAAAALGGVLAEQDRQDEALGLLRRAVAWDSRSADARVLLGRLLENRGDNGEALFMFEEALCIDPTSPGAHAALADRLAADDRVDEALEHYDSAARLTDQSGEFLIRYADALLSRERYAEAIERYRQALWKIEADNATLNRVAWLLATCPRAELRDCRRAIEIAEHLCTVTDHRHAVALDTLAAAYAECGRWADAARSAKRALALAEASGDRAAADAVRRRLAIYEERSSTPRQAPPGHRGSPPAERP